MIQVYSPSNKDYEKNGDMVLFPKVAYTLSKLNKEWTASLVHPIDNEGRWKHLVEDAVVKMPSFNGDQLYRIRKLRKADSGITCTMEPIFYDMLDDGFLIDVRPTNATGQEALDKILQKTSYSKYLGESDISTRATAYYQYKNTLEAINGDIEQSFMNRWGGEIEFDNFTIRINKKMGSDKGVELRYGKNVVYDGLTEEIDTRDVVTRIYPKAYNGRTMTDNGYVDSENINKFPIIRKRALNFDDVKLQDDITEGEDTEGITVCATQEELDVALTAKCQAYYEAGGDKPKVTINADMIIIQHTDLYGGYSFLETVSLGDIVHCRHDKLDITTDSRVIELKYDSIRKKVSKAVIGDFKKDYFELFGFFLSKNFGSSYKNLSSTGGSNSGSSSGTGDSGNSGGTEEPESPPVVTTYTWEKYEAVEQQGITYESGTTLSLSLITKLVLYADFRVDSGRIVLSNPVNAEGDPPAVIESNSYHTTHPYYYGDKADGSSDNTPYKITSFYKSGSYGYMVANNKMVLDESGISYTKGDYIGEVTSKTAGTYPDNGYQNGYWYIKK